MSRVCGRLYDITTLQRRRRHVAASTLPPPPATDGVPQAQCTAPARLPEHRATYPAVTARRQLLCTLAKLIDGRYFRERLYRLRLELQDIPQPPAISQHAYLRRQAGT